MTKFCSNVTKLALVTAFLVSFSVHAKSKSPNERMVLGNLRLSLWYTGVQQPQENLKNPKYKKKIEELERALMRYENELEVASVEQKK